MQWWSIWNVWGDEYFILRDFKSCKCSYILIDTQVFIIFFRIIFQDLDYTTSVDSADLFPQIIFIPFSVVDNLKYYETLT